MSQPPKNRGTNTDSNAGNSRKPGQQTQRPGTTPARSGTRPPVARQQVYGTKGRAQQPPQTGFRASFDKALPPFSAQRYVVIWLGFIIVAALVFLLLAQPWKGAQVATSTDKYMVIETPKGTIVAKLYTDASAGVSKTIANFQTKADAGFFNGLTFHRVEDWVIQGGDPLGTGSGGGTMPSEYNKITFKAGALGVARGGDAAINNDSQFFITKKDSAFLDGNYTNWGQVVQGMDVVNKIAIGDKMTKVTITDKLP
ncbi:MAG: peptidylprolyl isomerase [Chloroflexota bacterium]